MSMPLQHKENNPKTIEISIIVVLKGALAYTSLGEEHRKPWGLSAHAREGEREVEIGSKSEREIDCLLAMGIKAHCRNTKNIQSNSPHAAQINAAVFRLSNCRHANDAYVYAVEKTYLMA